MWRYRQSVSQPKYKRSVTAHSNNRCSSHSGKRCSILVNTYMKSNLGLNIVPIFTKRKCLETNFNQSILAVCRWTKLRTDRWCLQLETIYQNVSITAVTAKCEEVTESHIKAAWLKSSILTEMPLCTAACLVVKVLFQAVPPQRRPGQL